MTEEKEFKLIEKRNEMRKATFELATTDDEKVLITTIFMLITKQDKEWIRLLKEDLPNLFDVYEVRRMIREEIDKRTGFSDD